MKLLVVAPMVPHDAVRHAGGQFLHAHLADLTAQGASVTLYCFADDEPTDGRLPDGVEVFAVTAGPPGGRVTDAIASRLHRDALSRSQVDALFTAGLVEAAQSAEVVELHWTSIATLVPRLRRAGVRTPISVLEHDVGAQAQRDRIKRYGSRRARLAQPLLDLARDRNEARDLNQSDLVLVFKDSDEGLLRAMGVRTEVAVVEPNLDRPSTDAPSRTPGEVVFTGALWRRENIESVSWLIDEVWPRVASAEPLAHLTIAGAGPPADLVARAPERVTFTGEVPDLGPFYYHAVVCVAPLLVGGGLKFKVPQAMVRGLPVVGTTLAVQGLESAPLWAVTDDPIEMADELVRAIRNPDDAVAVGEAARAWATSHFSFEQSTARLLARYQGLIEKR